METWVRSIFNVLELLEDNHIKVLEVNYDDAFDGMQTWSMNQYR